MSVAYPDVLDIIREVADANPDLESIILDSELNAYEIKNDKIMAFQALAGR